MNYVSDPSFRFSPKIIVVHKFILASITRESVHLHQENVCNIFDGLKYTSSIMRVKCSLLTSVIRTAKVESRWVIRCEQSIFKYEWRARPLRAQHTLHLNKSHCSMNLIDMKWYSVHSFFRKNIQSALSVLLVPLAAISGDVQSNKCFSLRKSNWTFLYYHCFMNIFFTFSFWNVNPFTR